MQKSPKNDGVWMSRQEAAELFGVTTSTIFYWEKRGILTGCKPGSYCLVSVASVEARLAWMKQVKNEALALAKAKLVQ